MIEKQGLDEFAPKGAVPVVVRADDASHHDAPGQYLLWPPKAQYVISKTASIGKTSSKPLLLVRALKVSQVKSMSSRPYLLIE